MLILTCSIAMVPSTRDKTERNLSPLRYQKMGSCYDFTTAPCGPLVSATTLENSAATRIPAPALKASPPALSTFTPRYLVPNSAVGSASHSTVCQSYFTFFRDFTLAASPRNFRSSAAASARAALFSSAACASSPALTRRALYAAHLLCREFRIFFRSSSSSFFYHLSP